MTHKERVLNALACKPVDRLPYGDGLWPETQELYVQQGKMKKDEDAVRHFDMSWRAAGWPNYKADIDFKNVVLEETEDTILQLDGNGASLRFWKNKMGTPEHVGFKVTDRESWEKLAKPGIVDTDPRRRVDVKSYKECRELAAREGRAFFVNGIAPFEMMHPLCGHENMLMGMALDPDWVKDMVNTYTDTALKCIEHLFREGGVPDACWLYEDMGFKEKPFMSPAMYEDIIMPGHKRIFSFMHDYGLKVLVHSCGFVEPLVPGLIKAGMDCLQAMECKAGMDIVRLAKTYGGKISFCGGLDIRIIATNDRAQIDAELRRKIPAVLASGSGFILHSDHSIPPQVEYDTLKYFFEKGSAMAAAR